MMEEIEGVFYDDPEIPEERRDTISVLSREDAGERWDKYVSSNNRHFMLMDDSEWPAKIISSSEPFVYWADFWNSNLSDKVGDQLKSEFGVSPAETVLVFWMKEHCVETVWSTFCDHWVNFLYEDEGVMILFPRIAQAFVFSNGRAWVGERDTPLT